MLEGLVSTCVHYAVIHKLTVKKVIVFTVPASGTSKHVRHIRYSFSERGWVLKFW